jgi:uncharacterized protein (DUF2336 family)
MHPTDNQSEVSADRTQVQTAEITRGSILDLAHSRRPGDRDRLLLAVADLCEHSDECTRAEVQTVLSDVFMSLIGQVEREIRRQLAEKLAGADWAPRDLIAYLARDDVEIARPIIARSPLLEDQDLIRLLVEASLEHHIEIARRPALPSRVVDVILAQGQTDVLAALATNESAELSPLAMERLVCFSQTIAALRAPLSHHPRLTTQLGAMLYVWVGETLRAVLSDRFEVDKESFREAVNQAVDQARGAPGDNENLEFDERAAMDRRMVEKLKAGGQLRPGLLLRALRESKLTLFTIALAQLGDFSTDDIRAALQAEDATPLALACAAVGVDRGALPTVLSLVRQLNNGRPCTPVELNELARTTASMDRATAAEAFREQAAARTI